MREQIVEIKKNKHKREDIYVVIYLYTDSSSWIGGYWKSVKKGVISVNVLDPLVRKVDL